MEAFPAELSYEGVRDALRKKAEADVQSAGMKEVRGAFSRMIQKVLVEDGESSVVLPLHDIPKNYRVPLTRELCQRFPGHVLYHRIVEFADIDRFELIEDEKNPKEYFEIKITMDDAEVARIAKEKANK